jgi:GxxExxY protein
MPIEVSTGIRACNQEEFHALDRQVMRVAFEVHNEFGRLLDEELYKREIATRCLARGIEPVEREVRIRVTHETFAKDYCMDLLFCQGSMLEGKAAERLVAAHRTQALNYLLLAGLKHGRLVNFRTERLQHEFVSTTLTLEERRRFKVVDDEWVAMNPASQELKVKTIDLLKDWGAFLDANLYREALVHFLGGSSSVCQSVEVFSGATPIGSQKLNLLAPDTAFALTMKQRQSTFMRDHLERLLRHTGLKAIQWINLNRHLAEFATLRLATGGSEEQNHGGTESWKILDATVTNAVQPSREGSPATRFSYDSVRP